MKYLNKINILIIFVLAVMFMPINSVYAEYPTLKEVKDYYISTFPSGTYLRGILREGISTGVNQAGDQVTLILSSNMFLQDVLCIPKDTLIVGKIVRLQRAKMGTNGLMQIVFNELILPTGQKIPMLGHVWSKNDEGMLGGDASDRTSFRSIPSDIEGIPIFVRTVPYGPRSMGKETEFPSSTEWIIVLDREITITVEKE